MRLHKKLIVSLRLIGLLFFCSAPTVLFTACKTAMGDLSQENGIERLRKLYKSQDWAELITGVDEYKTRYPYSQYGIEADLMQADAYYQSDRFPEAIAAYGDFIRKHPMNAAVALANFRIAKGYDLQAPTAEDREQLNTEKALNKYRYFVATYPADESVQEARDRITVLHRRLAMHAAFVANFYWQREQYAAALSRYLSIVKKFSQYPDLQKTATERATACYNKLADLLAADPESDKYVYFANTTPDELRSKAAELSTQ